MEDETYFSLVSLKKEIEAGFVLGPFYKSTVFHFRGYDIDCSIASAHLWDLIQGSKHRLIFDPSKITDGDEQCINESVCRMEAVFYMVFLKRLVSKWALHTDYDKSAYFCLCALSTRHARALIRRDHQALLCAHIHLYVGSTDTKSAFRLLWLAVCVWPHTVVHILDVAFVFVAGPFGVATMPKGWVALQSAVYLSLRIQYTTLYLVSMLFTIWCTAT